MSRSRERGPVGFDKGEYVYAYHGPLLFKALVIDKTERSGGAAGAAPIQVRLYKLHYLGYSSHWDEWTPESRLMKDSSAAEELQKERVREFHRAHKKRKAHEALGGAAGESVGAAASASGAGGATGASEGADADGSKRAAKGGVEQADDALAAEIRDQLRLPQGLKLKLIEDWEKISRERVLVPLPRSPSVHELLLDFVATKAKRSSHERLYTEVCDGLRAYFNQALGAILLYKFERKQLTSLRAEQGDLPLVELYGAEHLLRLVVKLPELLSHAKLQREHMTVLVAKLMELLKFLQANKTKYFVNEYEQPDAEYVEWWNSQQ